MKYILICVAALAACLCCAWFPARCIGKKKNLNRIKTLFLTLFFSLLLICMVTVGYLNIYYHADSAAEISSQLVQMEKVDGGYFFDGPGEDFALIFYPGAKWKPLLMRR